MNTPKNSSYAVGISGGGANFSWLAGAYEATRHRMELDYNTAWPKHLIGVSAGSAVATLAGMGLWSKVDRLTCVRMRDVFDIAPVTSKGRPQPLNMLRALITRSALGSQENLKKLIKEVVTPEHFTSYCNNPYLPTIHVGVTLMNEGRVAYARLADYSYLDAIDLILGSMTIFPAVPPVKSDGEFYVDPGYIDHIGSHFLAEMFGEEIGHLVSIYARPEEVEPGENKTGFLHWAKRLLKIAKFGISKADEELADGICEDLGIEHYKIFQPPEERVKTYQFDPDLTIPAHNKGRISAEKQLKEQLL